MKVGTDGILFGAWANIETATSTPLKVLDIGTGSDLISLMLAQRWQGNMRAIAIDIDCILSLLLLLSSNKVHP